MRELARCAASPSWIVANGAGRPAPSVRVGHEKWFAHEPNQIDRQCGLGAQPLYRGGVITGNHPVKVLP